MEAIGGDCKLKVKGFTV